MRAVVITEPGGPANLRIEERADPSPAADEVVISVVAAGVNRADIHQREGNYPPPKGAPEWPGLEVAGTVQALGSSVSHVRVGDRVCALLAGGGYAERVSVPTTMLLEVPPQVPLEDAAALPEAIATVWSTIVMNAELRAGETLLVHGGSGGIGTIAIQLARGLGCRVAVTASSQEKLDACRRLGADILINYTEQDFVDRIMQETDGVGAHVVLDAIGGAYLERNIRALASRGRIELIGNQSGVDGAVSIGRLMSKWGSIHASTLRARTLDEKKTIMASVRKHAWPFVAEGNVSPVIDETFSFENARRAHEKMESGRHIGKLLLVP